MTIEKSVKVVLNSEEEKCLYKALDIINEIWSQARDYDCDIEFDDEENYNLLDEMHAVISVIRWNALSNISYYLTRRKLGFSFASVWPDGTWRGLAAASCERLGGFRRVCK